MSSRKLSTQHRSTATRHAHNRTHAVRYGTVSHEQAAEIHACNRLHERYGIPKGEARELMYEHLALILAGEAKRVSDRVCGCAIYCIEQDGGYWAVFDEHLRRIVTYLTIKPGLLKAYERIVDRRGVAGDDDEAW